MGKRKSVQYNCLKQEDLVKYMAKGYLNCQIIAKFDITEQTFYRWLREYPEFKEAYDRGLPKKKAFYAQKMQDMMEGKLEGKHSFKAAEAMLVNELDWKQKTADSSVNVNIHLSKTPAEILEYLKIQAQSIDLPIIDLNDTEFKLIESTEQDSVGASRNSPSNGRSSTEDKI